MRVTPSTIYILQRIHFRSLREKASNFFGVLDSGFRRNDNIEFILIFPNKNKKGKGREAFPFLSRFVYQPRQALRWAEAFPQAERPALAFSAKAANASLSNTARSASTLRSTSIAALCRPFIKRL